MFALVAAIIWFLAAFGVKMSGVDLVVLGLAFLGLHFAFAWVPWSGWRWSRQ